MEVAEFYFQFQSYQDQFVACTHVTLTTLYHLELEMSMLVSVLMLGWSGGRPLST